MNVNEFQHDQNDSDGHNDAGSDETTMPLGIGGTDDEGGLMDDGGFGTIEEESKRGVNSGAVLLIAVVLIAVVGLFSMRTITRASASSELPTEAEQSIESFLTMLQSSKSGDGQGPGFQFGSEEAAVLDVLNESYASRQVALTHVQRNPFIIFEQRARQDAPSRSQGPDPIEQKRQDRRALFEQAARRLELRSVLMGNTPLATIGSNIVQVGGTVIAEPEGVTFKVERIDSESVAIVAEDAELDVRYETTLSMDRNRTSRGATQRSTQRGPVRPR